MTKKITLLLFFLLTSNIYFYGQNSVFESGNWFKFAVDTTGVFKIDANFLQNLGINTTSINPRNIKIYGNGGNMLPELISDFRYSEIQENSIFVSGENDGVFNDNDYILFFAQGPHHWEVDTNNNTVEHIQNIYSDYSYYFLTIGDSPGKRITNRTPIAGTSSQTITQFEDYTFYEKEEINLIAIGRLWFGEDFSVENTKNFSIPFPNLVTNSDLTIKIAAVAQSSDESFMSCIANNQTLTPLSFDEVDNSTTRGLAKQSESSSTIQTNGNVIDIELNYNNNGIPSANAYLDYIEVFGKKELTVNNFQFQFRSFDVANTTEIFTYQIQNSQNISQVWEVTDIINPTIVSNESNTSNIFSFNDNGGSLKEYSVLTNNYYTPIQIDNRIVENQNIRSLVNTQYLIITSSSLNSQAQRLANYHQNNSGLTTAVVNLNKIYNEFSSGSPDITGIRDFIKYLYDNSSEELKLEYVCFFGDSSYDYKNRITGNNNVVPTYHDETSFNLVNSYVTDDYYVMISDDDGGMRSIDDLDIASGRIPVSTSQQAEAVVDKILKYYDTSSFGNWKNNITFIADDIDDEDADSLLQSDLERVADSVKKNKPQFNIKKIYLDAYQQESSSGGERYPDVEEDIINAIEKGTLVFDYFGHGGEDGLSQERVFYINRIKTLSNINTLPLFITVTCEFSRFDNPLRETAGEHLFWNEDGGAVSMITTTRDVLINQGKIFNALLAEYVFGFDENDDSIAQNLVKTKNETITDQRYFIFFFGDPAMKLAIPKPNIVLSKINDIDISQANDTLKALSRIKLEGTITDLNNNVLSDFNGTIYPTIFDKSFDRETLDNGNDGIVNTFDIQESKIFNGKASVQNGIFEFEFIVPKDIKTAYGNGKVSLYANNDLIEKGGYNYDIIIGGIDENAPEDNIGPEIQAYLNDESFIDGGNTNSSPNLIIKLVDDSGINTSLTAIDHDIVAILDGNEAEPIILNDYYETELDDFTQGEVNYQLRDLSTGSHTLTIKAWDTYNNSSEITLTFVVLDDGNLYLENVLNYPNPFVNYTEFWFNHNKPYQPLEVQVQIFTVSGKLIKTINQAVQTTGSLSRSINWDGLDDFGNKIAKGVYVYKLKVTSTNDSLTSEKFEKLVIL